MWYVFQGLIVFFIALGNVHHQWTTNWHLIGLLGFGVAYVASLALRAVIDLWRPTQPNRNA